MTTDVRAHAPRQLERGRNTSRNARAPARKDGSSTQDDPQVTDLVTRARNGDKQAWHGLVERYAPLIWSICRRHGLGGADEDVVQAVWLHLVDQLDNVRDPAALPGWIATTTWRECYRVRRAARRAETAGLVPDLENIPDTRAPAAEHELLLAERNAALREAFSDLPPGCRRLIGLLVADPPVPYAEISATLGIPVGSIGPNRGRCLERMRRPPAIAVLMNTEAANEAGEVHGGQWRGARPGASKPARTRKL